MNPLLSALILSSALTFAADTPTKAPTPAPKAEVKKAPPRFQNDGNPEHLKNPLLLKPDENVAYGPHRMQVMYFWRAKSDKPTPVLFYIHGGGWTNGDRSSVNGLLKPCLEAGISVVSVEYRYIKDATADKVVPPVKGPMLDCARALQFVRSKAKEWNLDKTRVGASGGSAGACTSLWLAFHDDLAEPQSADPIARESTRLTCAAVNVPQTSLDPHQMRAWTPNSSYGGHAFGISGDAAKKISTFQAFYDAREKILPWIKEYSPYELASKDDAPVGLYFPTVPNIGQDEKDATHSANFGVKLKEHCDELKLSCELVYPGAPNVQHPKEIDFLKAYLLK